MRNWRYHMDMRFAAWNVRTTYRTSSLRTVAEKYKLDLIGIQEVRWDGDGTEPAGDHTFFYGKGNEEKRSLGRPRRRLVDNIKIYLRKIGWGDVDWIYMAQDRDQWRALVNTVMNLRVP
jgi:hypothetical protein